MAFMTKRRLKKIVLGIVVGMLLGSSMGIAAFGTAIAGTLPMGVLGGYLVWSWTRPKALSSADTASPDKALRSPAE